MVVTSSKLANTTCLIERLPAFFPEYKIPLGNCGKTLNAIRQTLNILKPLKIFIILS
jgi:hypothetical protein